VYGRKHNFNNGRSCILSNRIIKDISRHDIPLDYTDFKIVALLCSGRDNRQISTQLKIPLSTIQRRTRNIISSGVVNVGIQPNFKRLGLKRGLLHVNLYDGDIRKSVAQLSKMDGMISSSVQIGNSDVVSDYAYENTDQLMDTISSIKHMEGVDKVTWSEEVYREAVGSENILSSFKNVWNNSNNNSVIGANPNNKYNIHKNNNAKLSSRDTKHLY
jgi:DNA-binding Lrp family transcriptional regulator